MEAGKHLEHYRFRVGNREVLALQDGLLHVPQSVLMSEGNPEEQERLTRELPDPMEWSNNVFVVMFGDRKVLIDTGGGDLFPPDSGQLVAALAAAGLAASDITDACLTHLHPDHIGGLIYNEQKVFSNARLHVNKTELDYWLSADSKASAPAHHSVFFEALESKFLPYHRAGLVRSFEEGEELFPGLTSRLLPGHTPGLSAFILSAGDARLTFIGDLFNEPAQVRFPELKLMFDWNPSLAMSTRVTSLGNAADAQETIAVPHAAFPGLNQVVRDGDAFQLVPSETESSR